MPDPRALLDRLTSLAPRVDKTLLRVIADLMADDCLPVGVLLNVGDALGEAYQAAMLDGRLRDAVEIGAVSMVVAREAERPRPGFW
jgi:hypothetical protein